MRTDRRFVELVSITSFVILVSPSWYAFGDSYIADVFLLKKKTMGSGRDSSYLLSHNPNTSGSFGLRRTIGSAPELESIFDISDPSQKGTRKHQHAIRCTTQSIAHYLLSPNHLCVLRLGEQSGVPDNNGLNNFPDYDNSSRVYRFHSSR